MFKNMYYQPPGSHVEIHASITVEIKLSQCYDYRLCKD